MTPEEYLQNLRNKLGMFSHTNQIVLIEEIGSHIESGENDPKLGFDPAERRKKLMSELGTPKQMARGFEQIYQTGSLINYLLIAIPYLLNLPINLLLLSLIPKYSWADARLVVVFHLLILAIGIWRRSILVILYWLADLAVQLLGVLVLVNGFYGTFQTTLWCIVLAGLFFMLGRVVWQNRQDILIIIFALLPFIMGVFALLLGLLQPSGRGDASLFLPFNIYLLRFYNNYASFMYYGMVVVLAPFFLIRNRDFRWGALLLYWLFSGLYRNWLGTDFIFSTMFNILWLLFPVFVVLSSWFLERHNKQHLKFAT